MTTLKFNGLPWMKALLLSLLFVTTLSVTSKVSAKSVYMIGNSVTDTVDYEGFADFATSSGYSHTWGRHMIPGAPLEWIWGHPSGGFQQEPYGYYQSALGNYEWDVITLQPFDRRLPNEADYSSRFINLAKSKSPNPQVYMMAWWPRQRNGDFDTHWLKSYSGDSSFDETIITKEYFELLTTTLRAQHSDIKPVRMIPVGHVMYALNQKIKANQVPGLTKISDLYIDDIHLNNIGQFVTGATFFATIYQQNPSGLVPSSDYGSISSSLATVVYDTVWQVVSTHPLSGVAGAADISISSDVLALGVVDSLYDETLNASGGTSPYTWSLDSGSLPPGITLTSDGALSGTPSTAGNYGLTLRVSDSDNNSVTKFLTLSVEQGNPLVISSNTVIDAVRGTRYETNLATTGGVGVVSWSLESGALPVGMSLTDVGFLSGTPGVEGSFSFTVAAEDITGDRVTKSLSLFVNAANTQTLLIPKVIGTTVIDGELNEEIWVGTNTLSEGMIGSPNNTVSFDAAWNEQYLYIGAEIVDDNIQNDAVQIFIDAQHDREATYNNDDRQIIISADGSISESSGRITGVLHEAKQTVNGFIVEVAIPWVNLERTPYANMTIGFDIGNDDDDNGGERDHYVGWFGVEPANPAPIQMGNMLLSEREVTIPTEVANTKPRADMSVQTTERVAPVAITVDASDSSDAESGITYLWEFGVNNEIASTEIASYTYQSAGTYTIKLTVTDDKGAKNSTQQNIILEAQQEEPEPQESQSTSGGGSLSIWLLLLLMLSLTWRVAYQRGKYVKETLT